MPSLNTGNAILSNPIKVDSSYNVGIGGAASSSFKLNVTGTTNLTGALTTTDLNVSDTYANDPLIRLATTTSGNVEVQMRTATTTYNAGIGVVTSGYDFSLFTNNTPRLTLNGTTGAATFTGNNATNTTENASVSWNDANGNLMGRIVGYRGANGNDGNLRFYTSNTPTLAMTISSGGNVGIGTGTDAPLSRLQVQGSGGSTGVTLTLANGGNIDAIDNPLGIINFYSNDTSSGASGVFGSISLRNEFGGNWDGNPDREITYMNFSTATSGSVVERMRISSGGQTLINTARTSGANVNAITIADNVTGVQTSGFGVRILATSNNGQAKSAIAFEADGGTNNDTAIAFYTQTNAASLDRRMTINRNGNVLINTTTDNGDKLNISGATSISGNLGVGRGSESGVRLSVTGATNGSDSYATIMRQTSGQDLFIVRSDGNINTGTRAASPYNAGTTGRTMVIESTGGLGYNTSTRESKINIEKLNDVSWLYKLNPVSFNYRKKDDEMNYTDEAQDEKWYGLIADEVESINDDLVFYNTKEDGSKQLAGVEYNKIIAALIKSSQQQQAQIEAQQQQINSLINR